MTPSRNPSQAPDASFAVGSGEVGHTPGPWRKTLDDFGDYTIQTESAELVIATVVNGSLKNLLGESAEQAANARLIAAAPDLLAALQAVSRKMDKHGDPDTALYDFVDAAIAKALTPEPRP